jgi:hypothetical protein
LGGAHGSAGEDGTVLSLGFGFRIGLGIVEATLNEQVLEPDIVHDIWDSLVEIVTVGTEDGSRARRAF